MPYWFALRYPELLLGQKAGRPSAPIAPFYQRQTWGEAAGQLRVKPQTLRDATEIAERFRARYVWIDRLCIFQDSLDDRRRQASSMHHVYRNALLSIAALGAEDADEGCFFDGHPSQAGPTVVQMLLLDALTRMPPYNAQHDYLHLRTNDFI